MHIVIITHLGFLFLHYKLNFADVIIWNPPVTNSSVFFNRSVATMNVYFLYYTVLQRTLYFSKVIYHYFILFLYSVQRLRTQMQWSYRDSGGACGYLTMLV